MKSFANETPCGARYLTIGLPIFTILFSIITLIILLILNKIYKKNIIQIMNTLQFLF